MKTVIAHTKILLFVRLGLLILQRGRTAIRSPMVAYTTEIRQRFRSLMRVGQSLPRHHNTTSMLAALSPPHQDRRSPPNRPQAGGVVCRAAAPSLPFRL